MYARLDAAVFHTSKKSPMLFSSVFLYKEKKMLYVISFGLPNCSVHIARRVKPHVIETCRVLIRVLVQTGFHTVS